MRPAVTKGSLRGFSVPLGGVTLAEGVKGTDSGLSLQGTALSCSGVKEAPPLTLSAATGNHKLALYNNN